MKISYRLYLTVTPAIIGVLLMAGLFYWGQYEHTAPTIVLARRNRRSRSVGDSRLDQRAVRRATDRAPGDEPCSDAAGAPDELDRIARGVDRLSTDVQIAEADRVDRERLLVERTRDYARLLASIADDTAGRLEEIRLPLHILLENRFGDLNENQEEMLGAARVAAEAADADLVSLRQIAELDLGDHPLRRDRMKPSDIVEALRPMLVAAAESAGAAVEVSVAPLLPAIIGDRARLQDALATLLGDAVRSSASGTRVRMSVEQQNDKLTVEVLGTRGAPSSVRSAAAARVIDAHGGSVSHRDDALVLTLPLENRPTSTRTRVPSASADG